MNTTEIINYATDLQIDFRIKVLLLFIFVGTASYGWYYSNNKEAKTLWQWQLKKIVSQISKTYIFLSPIWIFLLSRNVPIDTFLKFMLIIYSGVLVMAFVLFFIFGMEWLIKFFSGENYFKARNLK